MVVMTHGSWEKDGQYYPYIVPEGQMLSVSIMRLHLKNLPIVSAITTVDLPDGNLPYWLPMKVSIMKHQIILCYPSFNFREYRI
jgi:hypothetical protein